MRSLSTIPFKIAHKHYITYCIDTIIYVIEKVKVKLYPQDGVISRFFEMAELDDHLPEFALSAELPKI